MNLLEILCSISSIGLHLLFPALIIEMGTRSGFKNMIIYIIILTKYSYSAELEFKSVQMKKWRKKIQKKLECLITRENA